MKKITILSAAALLTVAAVFLSSFAHKEKGSPAQTAPINLPVKGASKWVVDKAHSNVKFAITHLVVSEVEGSFKLFDGSLEHTKADFSDAVVSFTVDVASINTDNEMRDKHLKGDDFFSAEKFPAMKFQSTSMVPAGGNKYKLNGNLTIRDVTKPVTFDVTYGGTANAIGKTKTGFKAKTTINRFDYNLKWNNATEAGGMVVSKDVDITVNVELNKS